MLYRSNKLGDPIFFHSGGMFEPNDNTSPVEEQGWYFSDETWSDYNGPYQSYGECEEAIERYSKQYLGGKI